MSIWLAIPSARPNGGTIPQWKERGYRVALLVDWNPPGVPLYSRVPSGDIMLCGGGQYQPVFDPKTSEPFDPEARTYPPHFNGYPGYARSVNALVAEILKQDQQAEWVVCGGDDTQPDLHHTPEGIARQCTEHFGGTFGIMQPTGDRFAGGSIDRIAGSPWMGREWCLRANQGKGPLWPEFTHMFVDEALMCVAEKLGVYWRRPDLIHLHHHFMRQSTDLNSPAVGKPIPDHLKQWNTKRHWDESKAIFERLKAQDFAPCMPLPVEVCA